MFKRILAVLLAAALTAGAAACSQQSESNPSSGTDSAASETSSADSGEKVHLTYAFWGGEAEAEATQITLDQFNESQDRIEVEAMPIPWETYMEKLNTMATANELPDTAIMSEAGCIQWAEQGMLMDLGAMYEGAESQPLEQLGFTYDGKVVAYSTAFNFLTMFYNKDMFDAANVEYPPTSADEAWSWDEFVDVSKKLTLDKNGLTPNDAGFDPQNIVQYGCMVENLTWQLEVWCRSNGSGFYDKEGNVTINDPAAVEAIQKVADLYLVDKVAPLSTGLTDDGVSRSLIAGTCAMTTNGNWNIGTTLGAAKEEGLNYGIAVLPYMKDKVTINTGGPNVVFNQTEYPDESMEFLRWYGSEDNNWRLIAEGTWNPTLESYYTDETLTKKWLENPNFPEYEDSKAVLVDYGMEYSQPTSWYYVNNTDPFNSLLGSILGDVWTGKTTAEQAINDNLQALESAHQGMA